VGNFGEYVPAPQYSRNSFRSEQKNLVFNEKFLVDKIKIEPLIDHQIEIDYDRVSNILLNFDQKLWEPILIDDDYYLLDGRHRLEVAKLLRLRYIDVIIENDDINGSEGDNKEADGKPNDFELEQTTVWDFPKRGSWATHKSDYRGNFAPQVARNVILNYSQEQDLILDPMVGGGTTLIEARLLNRNAIGYDVNFKAVEITKERLNFWVNNNSKQAVSLGDVRCLTELKDNSVDLILTHPPYANIITYSNGENPDDLSSISSINVFLDQLELGLREMFRVLKPNRYCAILIGDTRKSQHYVPLSFFLLERYHLNKPGQEKVRQRR